MSLTDARLTVLRRLHSALVEAADALATLNEIELASPLGQPKAWAYPEFLLAAATGEVNEAITALVGPPPPDGRRESETPPS